MTKWTNEDNNKNKFTSEHLSNCDCVGCIKKRSKFRMNKNE